MKTQERNSNIEILRIFSMFLIILHHIGVHCINLQLTDSEWINKLGNGLFNHPYFYTKLILPNFLVPIGNVGNVIFILISGYFLIENTNINLTKISKKLLMQLCFSVIVLVCVSTFIFKMKRYTNILFINSETNIELMSISSFNEQAWFVGYYFSIIVVARIFLNSYLRKLKKQDFISFLLTIFCLVQFVWSGNLLNGFAPGLKTLVTGVFLYLLGGYMSLYNPFKNIKTWTFYLVIIFMFVLITISIYNNTQNSISKYLASSQNNSFFQSVIVFDNSSAIVVVIGICLFEIFLRLKFRNNNIINFIGQSTFMIYLIHDNEFFYSLWLTKDWISILYNQTHLYMLELIQVAFLTFLGGFITYIIYIMILKLKDIIKWIFLYDDSTNKVTFRK